MYENCENCIEGRPRIGRLVGVTRTLRLAVFEGEGVPQGTPQDLTGKTVVVRVLQDGTEGIFVPEFVVEGTSNNVVKFTWPANRQAVGNYTFDITITDGSGNVSRVNWHGRTGIRLVAYSNEVYGEDATGVKSNDEIGLIGYFTTSGEGMSAYEEWLASDESEGYERTVDGFFEWMRKPASDAAAAAEAQMTDIQSRADEDHRVAGADHTLADSDHTRAGNDHTRAEGDHTTAADDHRIAASDHETAGNDHTRSGQDHDTAAEDHRVAGIDHGTAADDHTRAGQDHQTASDDHTQAGSDHTRAGEDHTRAGDDHQTASSDHTRAGEDHTTAGSDHTRAGEDHTQAGNDHTRAEADHGIAADDHTQAVADHAIVGGYNTRLTNVEGEVSQLGQEVDAVIGGDSIIVNKALCNNAGYIDTAGGVWTSGVGVNYGHSDVIPVEDNMSLRISGVGTNMPYFVFCQQDGTFIRRADVSTGITSVYNYSFVESGYIKINGRVVPDANGIVVAGLILNGKPIPEIIELLRANVKKYVATRGAVYTKITNGVNVVLGDLLIYDVTDNAGRTISDSNTYTISFAGSRFLVLDSNDTIQLRLTSSNIQKEDYVLLYYDPNQDDIVAGALYEDYINRVKFGTLPDYCIDVNKLLNHPAAYSTRAEARKAIPANKRFTGLTITYIIDVDGTSLMQKETYIYTAFDNSTWGSDLNWIPDYPNVKKYVATRGAVYDKKSNYIDVQINTLFAYNINKPFGVALHTISDTTTYRLKPGAIYLVITADNTLALRTNSSGLHPYDFVLLFYDTTLHDIKGGALYPEYLDYKLANAPSQDSIKAVPSNLGQINCIRKAYQMATFKWTPKIANTVPYNNGTFPASEQEGMIYSSVKEYSQFVFEDVSLETFMTAVNNPRSVLYTENVSAANSRSSIGRTYKGINCAAYYGSVCSGLLTFAYGLPMNVTTYEFRNWDRMEVIQDQTPYGLEIGDAVWQSGHIQLVTGITKDNYGFITDVEIVENAAATTQIKHYSTDALQSYITSNSCVLLRYKDLYANRSYNPLTQFVAVMGETQGSYTYNDNICPNYGDKSNYNVGDDVVLNLRTDYASAGYTTLEVYKGDTLLVSRTISGQDETLTGLEYGDYKARIVGPDSLASEYVYFKVVDAQVIKSGDSFSFSSANATSLYYEFCDQEGRRSYDIVGLSTHTFTSAELSSGEATPSGAVVSTGNYHYLKVHFQTDYGRVVKVIDWNS